MKNQRNGAFLSVPKREGHKGHDSCMSRELWGIVRHAREVFQQFTDYTSHSSAPKSLLGVATMTFAVLVLAAL